MPSTPPIAPVVPAAGVTRDDELMTGEAVALQVRPTAFVLRAAGAMIDFVAYIGLWLLIVLGITSPLLAGVFDSASQTAILLSALVFCVVVIPTGVELLTQGKSLGRLAVGARIVRDDGGAIGFRHAFIRALTGVFEIILTFGGVAAMVALLNPRTKRLGDLIAGTYSQYERVSKATPPVFGVPAELATWAETADVARLPDGLARRISQFLGQANRLSPQARTRLGSELSAEASSFVSPVPLVDAELFLAAVSAMRRDRESTALELERALLHTLEPALTELPHGFPERADRSL